MNIRPKKSLGQHFLADENIAKKIIGGLSEDTAKILEIGPGTGVLSKYLYEDKSKDIRMIETDPEAVEYLKINYPELQEKIILNDFLKTNLHKLFDGKFTIIGNFPYNISSPIFFKILEHRQIVDEVVCMIQKEVAGRIVSKPGNKTYGILSVLLSAYYNIEYLFTVSEKVFVPRPKVKSAVIKLKRNAIDSLDCKEKLFFNIVKSGFNYRRKTLRNSLKFFLDKDFDHPLLKKRAEELKVEDYELLARLIA